MTNSSKGPLDRFFAKAVEAAVLVVVALLIVEYISRPATVVLEVVVTAWLVIVIAALISSRHILWLWTVGPRSSPRRLCKIRAIALAGQKDLANQFSRLKARFVALLDSGELDDATYQEQMVFAGLFYATQRERLWATSVDPWSEFLRTNEAYSRLMRDRGEHLPNLNENPLTTEFDDNPPSQARVFILPADRFVKDIVRDPSAARALVNCHLRLWRSYPHLMLVAPRVPDVAGASSGPAIWEEMLALSAPSAVSTPSTRITDFMLVDDRFVYGRVDPEILEDSIPLLRTDLTLRFSESPAEAVGYERVFRGLWKGSVSLQRFGREMRSVSNGNALSAPHPSVSLAQTAMTDQPQSDAAKLYSLLDNASDDITDYFDDGERNTRYKDFFAPAERAAPIGDTFIAKMRAATNPSYAIDQADVKRTARFCTTWMKDEAYQLWSDAFCGSGSAVRQRIFVLKDWDLAEEIWLSAFLLREVVTKGVQVGLILEADLKAFAEESRGLDAADHDAEWIIVNANQASGHLCADETTVGLSLGSAKVKTDEKNYNIVKINSKDLMCERLMNKYLKWHEDIWNSAPKLERLLSQNNVERFLEKMRMMTSPPPGSGFVAKSRPTEVPSP